MDPLHERTCGIRAFGACRPELLFFLPGNTVGPCNDRAAVNILELIIGSDHMHSLSFKIGYNFLIVDDRTVSINRAALFDLFIYHIHRTVHTEAETGALCSNDLGHIPFHPFPDRQELRPAVACSDLFPIHSCTQTPTIPEGTPPGTGRELHVPFYIEQRRM